MPEESGRLVRKVEYGTLAGFYGALLTKTQQTLLRLYCDEDLSLGEIAEQMNITRQGVQDGLNRAYQRLCRYEDALGLYERFRGIEQRLEKTMELLNGVEVLPGHEEALQKAKALIDTLREEEEQ